MNLGLPYKGSKNPIAIDVVNAPPQDDGMVQGPAYGADDDGLPF